MTNPIPGNASEPLKVEEVISFLRKRWGVTYQLKLLVKGNNLYLQIMWGYLEQQSFPLNEEEYREELSKIIEVVNRLNQTSEVRAWLLALNQKPRLGRALSLPLMADERLEEFLL